MYPNLCYGSGKVICAICRIWDGVPKLVVTAGIYELVIDSIHAELALGCIWLPLNTVYMASIHTMPMYY